MERMQTRHALAALGALAQASRLAVFRHLVQAGPGGGYPGDIAQALGLRPSTLSFHLKALAQAGLVEAEPQGRSILYRADFAAMRGLVDYLTENCCGGDAAACAPQDCTPANATAQRRRA
jgi:ArsR family transcriptional regulator, arsenate/arsenite/antimonite-responsive transcriptional repressor